jgi:hypothetical protein
MILKYNKFFFDVFLKTQIKTVTLNVLNVLSLLQIVHFAQKIELTHHYVHVQITNMKILKKYVQVINLLY